MAAEICFGPPVKQVSAPLMLDQGNTTISFPSRGIRRASYSALIWSVIFALGVWSAWLWIRFPHGRTARLRPYSAPTCRLHYQNPRADGHVPERPHRS